jgi:hypothetical protein
MRFLNILIKLGFISFNFLLLNGTANSQTPLLLRSTLSSGGASLTLSADGTKISFPQSIGQVGVTGVFNKKNLILRQGFIQPILIVKSFHEAENKNISIYPNPFSTVVFVKMNREETGNIELKIIDLAGKAVYIEKLPAQEIIPINLSFLYRGIYILIIRGNRIQINYKIIKY